MLSRHREESRLLKHWNLSTFCLVTSPPKPQSKNNDMSTVLLIYYKRSSNNGRPSQLYRGMSSLEHQQQYQSSPYARGLSSSPEPRQSKPHASQIPDREKPRQHAQASARANTVRSRLQAAAAVAVSCCCFCCGHCRKHEGLLLQVVIVCDNSDLLRIAGVATRQQLLPLLL